MRKKLAFTVAQEARNIDKILFEEYNFSGVKL